MNTPSYPHWYYDWGDPSALPSRGSSEPHYAIVGLAPPITRPTERKYEPFGGAAYSTLIRIVQNLEQDVYVTTLIKTPQNSKKKVPIRIIREWAPSLLSELKRFKPKRILAVGPDVAKILCPGFVSLREDHGALFRNSELDCIVVPTFAFGSFVDDPLRKQMITRDLERFADLPDPVPPEYILNPSVADLTLSEEITLDVETTGVGIEDTVTMLGIHDRLAGKVYIWSDPDVLFSTKWHRLLYSKIQKSLANLTGHNLVFDLTKLSVTGNFPWYNHQYIRDTMLMAHALGAEVLSLKHLTTMLTDRPGSHAMGGIEDPTYLAEDVLSTTEVQKQLRSWGAADRFATRLMCSVTPLISEMTVKGVRIDREKLKELEPKYRDTEADLLRNLMETDQYPINFKSSQQVVQFLLDHGVPLTERTDSGALTVKESVLLGFQENYPIVADLLKYREAIKEHEFISAYLAKTTDAKPYLHPRLKLTGARTGRLSCEDPNAQNVKRTGPIKTLFIPEEDCYYGLLDLSQAELRVACLLSGDELMMEALLSEDVHRIIASWLYGLPPEEISAAQRKRSKGITFGLLYGGSVVGLALRIGMPPAVVQSIVDKFFQIFTKWKDYEGSLRSLVYSQQSVSTIMGRTRDLRSLIAMDGFASAERKAINTPIQGTASDIALFLMNYSGWALREEHAKSRVLFGVHDSVLFNIHKTELDLLQKVTTRAFRALEITPLAKLELWGRLPFVGELIYGDSWAAVESTNENYAPVDRWLCSSHPEQSEGGVISERDYEEEFLTELEESAADQQMEVEDDNVE